MKPLSSPILLRKVSFPLVDLKSALCSRHSSRSYSQKKIGITLLSKLLLYSLRENVEMSPYRRRYYPSAGSCYPINTYIWAFNTCFPRGIYSYEPHFHSLSKMAHISNNLMWDNFMPQFAEHPPSILLAFVSNWSNITTKYGLRGKNYAYIEVGHMAQNIALLSESLGLNSTPVGGGYNERFMEISLNLKRGKESMIYLLALGHKHTYAQ